MSRAPGGAVAVVPYDPGWPDRFATEHARLVPLLARWLTGGVHHVARRARRPPAGRGAGLLPALAREHEELEHRLGAEADGTAACTTGGRAFVARVLAGAGVALG